MKRKRKKEELKNIFCLTSIIEAVDIPIMLSVVERFFIIIKAILDMHKSLILIVGAFKTE